MSRPNTTFSWDDEAAIVRGLEAEYPRVTRLGLAHAELDRMIRSLPGFVYGKGPQEEGTYNRLLLLWISLDEGDDDGRWDAYA